MVGWLAERCGLVAGTTEGWKRDQILCQVVSSCRVGSQAGQGTLTFMFVERYAGAV